MSNEQRDTEEWLEDFVLTMCKLGGFELEIEELALDDDDVLTICLSGPDSARAIGRDGQVLEAFQYLITTAAIHARMPHRRIVLDIDRYRERREQKLRDEVLSLADEVRSTGNPVMLAPMSPRERRVVHLTLAGLPGIATESQGQGEDRAVRILPAS
jgi:spoIIIJ-associated protein